MKGKFIINGKEWKNHLMDEAIKKIGRTLVDVAEIDNLLLWMSVGTSDATPDDTTLTALVAEVGAAAKYSIGSFSINSIFPFDLEVNITIPADDITASTVLKEVAVWWGPTGSKELFARATDATGITVAAAQAVQVKYELNIL